MSAEGHFTARELWYLAAAPAAWIAHFVFVYGAAAIVCARPGLAFGDLLVPALLATMAALAAVAVVARRGFRTRYRDPEPATVGTPLRRRPFLGGLLLGLAAAAGAGIVVTALVPVLVGSCA